MSRHFYNTVVVPVANFCFVWLGWTGVCVGVTVLLVWAAGVPR
jgi:hypothetical protein